MTFHSRAHLEATGLAGVEVKRDRLGLRGKQLSSFWIYVDEEDEGYAQHALHEGFWEAWITLWMDKHVKPGSTVIDIGANHGYYSFFLAKNKNCKVYAFEPQPRLAELMRQSEIANCVPIHIHEVAISDRDGIIEMTVPISHGMNATIANYDPYAPNGAETIVVETWPLDECFDTIDVDFIKVDAEGAEDLIWAGSKDFRRRHPQAVWLIEWSWDRYSDPATFGQEILDDYLVAHVNFQGEEEVIHQIEQMHGDLMLVLRVK